MKSRYYIRLDTPLAARGDDALRFKSHSAEGFAEELQDALRHGNLFDAWLATQQDPDEVDPRLAETDPEAIVEGQLEDLAVNLVVTTALNGEAFKHRLRLLAGHQWQLRDVTAA